MTDVPHDFGQLAGIRCYPFVHGEIGYGYLMRSSISGDRLWFCRVGPLASDEFPGGSEANRTLCALIATWLYVHNASSEGEWPPIASWLFVFFIRDDDKDSIEAINAFRDLWQKKYPAAPNDCPVFSSTATEAQVLEVVDDVLARWTVEHPGEPYEPAIYVGDEPLSQNPSPTNRS
jgi:hypothetical protein